MWASAPTGGLSSAGPASRFREVVLLDRIEEWFKRETYASFRPGAPRERFELQRVHRPAFARILIVRHDWRLREIVPSAFPTPRNEQAPAVA